MKLYTEEHARLDREMAEAKEQVKGAEGEGESGAEGKAAQEEKQKGTPPSPADDGQQDKEKQ